MPVHNTVHIAERDSVVRQLRAETSGPVSQFRVLPARNARLTGRAGSPKSASALSFSR